MRKGLLGPPSCFEVPSDVRQESLIYMAPKRKEVDTKKKKKKEELKGVRFHALQGEVKKKEKGRKVGLNETD